MKIKADKAAAEVIENLVDFALKAGGKLALQFVADILNNGIEVIEEEVEEVLDEITED